MNKSGYKSNPKMFTPPETTLDGARKRFVKQKMVVVKRPGDKHIKICENYDQAVNFFSQDTKEKP